MNRTKGLLIEGTAHVYVDGKLVPVKGVLTLPNSCVPPREHRAIVAGEAIEVLHVTSGGQEEWRPATVQHADPLQIVAVYADGQRHAVAPRHVRRAIRRA